MAIRNKQFIILLMGIVLFSSCYYDKKDQIYPQAVISTCDTSNVTYTATVSTILTNNCNSCHGASANISGGGISLSTYAAMKPYITNGKLINSILQNGQASAMPKNGAKLDACTINKIIVWINKGALNN